MIDREEWSGALVEFKSALFEIRNAAASPTLSDKDARHWIGVHATAILKMSAAAKGRLVDEKRTSWLEAVISSAHDEMQAGADASAFAMLQAAHVQITAKEV